MLNYVGVGNLRAFFSSVPLEGPEMNSIPLEAGIIIFAKQPKVNFQKTDELSYNLLTSCMGYRQLLFLNLYESLHQTLYDHT